MSFMTLKIAAPGVKLVQTRTLAMTNVVTSQLIRWREGLVEKLGGWAQFFGFPVLGPVRELWAWEDLNIQTHLAAAGDQGVSVITNNSIITPGPIYNVRTPTGLETTAGSASVLVDDVGSDASSYENVTLQVPYSVGGIVIYPNNYAITDIGSPDQYTIASTNLVTGAPLPAITSDTSGYLCTLTSTTSSYVITVVLANHGLSVGSNFSIVLPTTLGGVTLSGFYSVQTVEAAATASASAAYSSGSTFTVASAPSGVIPPGTLITDTTTGNPVGTFASISGTTITINEANPLHPVASGNALSFASGTFTIFAPNTATSNDTENYGNVALQLIQWVVATQTPPGGGWGDGGWGLGSWGESVPGSPVTGTTYLADDWCMANFGSILIMNPEDGPLFQWDPTIGIQSAQIIVPAPSKLHGFFIAMPEQMIVGYGASTQGVQDPMLVAWCDAGDFNTWIAGTTNQAGTYRLTRGSHIVGGLQGPLQGLLWTDVGLWLMQYIGYPDVWGFLEISQGCGLIAKKAAAVVGINVYWMSQDGFWMYGGGAAQRIPCDVWDVIKSNINTAFYRNIRAASNTTFDEITWYFPSTASTSGENDTYVKLNVLAGEWDYGSLAISEWIDQNVFGMPISAMPDGLGDGNSLVMQHEISPDANGQGLAYSFRTGYFQLSEAEDFVFADYVIPDFRWRLFNQANVISAEVQLTFFVNDWPDDPNNPPVAFGPYIVTNATQAVDIRCRGRYFSIEVAGNDIGSFMRLGGLKFRIAPDGRNPN
jgi:hypothetical protein